jgi:hypothetical protein
VDRVVRSFAGCVAAPVAVAVTAAASVASTSVTVAAPVAVAIAAMPTAASGRG